MQQVQPLRAGLKLQLALAGLGQRLNQDALALGIEFAHTAQMAQQVPFADETGQHVLRVARRVTIGQCPSHRKSGR